MSDSLSRAYDDYDAYLDLCHDLNITPLSMSRDENDGKSFYDHEQQLTEEHNLYKNYYGEYKKKN